MAGSPSTQITPADVLAQLVVIRDLVAQIPDGTPQKGSIQSALDLAATLVQKSQIPPGTYVTAGAAAALAGVAALVGAAGGGLVGYKLGKPKTPALPAHESESEPPPRRRPPKESP